jgi:hypothetical protein
MQRRADLHSRAFMSLRRCRRRCTRHTFRDFTMLSAAGSLSHAPAKTQNHSLQVSALGDAPRIIPGTDECISGWYYYVLSWSNSAGER